VKNAERVTATRAKLIDAAICSLAELGFHRTTFVEVSRRSELSRGAIHHHFDSIPDLMNAVARDLAARIRAEVTAGLERLPADQNICDAGIDFLWEQLQNPNHSALQHISNAISTDQNLRENVSAEIADVTQWLRERVHSKITATPGFDHVDSNVIDVIFTALTGAVAQNIAVGVPDEDPDRVEFCAALKRMARLANPSTPSKDLMAARTVQSAATA